MMNVSLIAIQEKLDEYGDHFRIASTVEAINIACEDDHNSGILIGHSKALVESVAKTILTEKKETFEAGASVNNLVKNAISILGVASNVENPSKAKIVYKKLLGSIVTQFETATSCYAELRNDFCPMAHGKSATHIPLDFSHALMIVRHVDAMVAFFLELYHNNPNKENSEDIAPEVEISFTEQLDDEFDSVEIYGDTYLPHDILKELNPKKYKESLKEYIRATEQEEESHD